MYEIRDFARAEFPERLTEIPQQAKRLRIAGVFPACYPDRDALFLAVVGSRKFTPYGKEACEKIISELAGSNVVIVSGLALGIDSIAHRAAMRAGLATIAFPGSGLGAEVIYPRTNWNLAQEIVRSGGALMSEFADDFKATLYSFPQRNRLMAGISHGVLIVEAEEKSGTLITARMALDYNRDVFTIPGSIFSRTSIGTNKLLHQGAIPVTCGTDILEHWGIAPEVSPEERDVTQSALWEQCSDQEKLIFGLIAEPCERDKVIRASGLPVNQANVLLTTMEIKGYIAESMGKIRSIL